MVGGAIQKRQGLVTKLVFASLYIIKGGTEQRLTGTYKYEFTLPKEWEGQ